jgi:uncharacterized protein YndB with AHSA1/START domain
MSDYGVLIAPRTVRLERVLPGPIERVWSYLVESDKRAEWLAGGTMEPRVGGKVELWFNHSTLTPHKEPTPEKYKQFDGKNTAINGRVIKWEPPRVLAIEWPQEIAEVGGNGAQRKNVSNVTFELEPDGKNVLLTITHRNLADRNEVVGVSGGWHTHTNILVDKLNGRVPKPFWAEHSKFEKAYEERIPRE